IAGVLVVGCAGRAWAQLAHTPWPMFRHDVQHTGRSPFLGPQMPHLRWASALGAIESSPAIGSDGTIYVGSTDGTLYAVTPTGTPKWTFATGNAISSSPALGRDGTLYLYVGGTGHTLYAVTPTGTLQWAFAPESGRSAAAPRCPGARHRCF